jgi:hypothetical protein
MMLSTCPPNGLRYLRVVAGAGKTVREAEAHHTSGARGVSPLSRAQNQHRHAVQAVAQLHHLGNNPFQAR